jgi:hypothetical protein
VKSDLVTSISFDIANKTSSINKDREYDDASRDYLITRGHMMSGINKFNTSKINQLTEEEKETAPQ